MKLPGFLKGVCDFTERYSPEILTGLGIAGFITTIVLAVKATPKAETLIVEAEDEKEEELTFVETVKAGFKPYIPAFITFVASTGCVVGAAKINNQRNAELATAYAISQAVIKRYDEKLSQAVGDEKANDIKEEIHKETVQTPEARKAIAKLPSNETGLHPYWDPLSNTPFYANADIIDKVEVRLNKRLYCESESYVTVSDLYDELNELGAYPPLKHTAVSPMLGWTAGDDGVKFSRGDYGEWDDGTPCRILGYATYHEPGYVR